MNNKSNKDYKEILEDIWKGTIYFLKKGGWFLFLMFFLDLGTKLGLNAYFGNPNDMAHPDVVIIPNVLKLTLTYNTGAAYGTGANMGPAMRIIFACVSFIVGVVIIVLLAKYFKKLADWKLYAIYLILAGDWGNFIDRAFYWNPHGIYGVIDWIAVGGPNWPGFLQFVCNWADVCLTFGAIILVVGYIIEWANEKYQENNREAEYQLKKKMGEEGGSYLMAENLMKEDIKKESVKSTEDKKKALDELETNKAEEKARKESKNEKKDENKLDSMSSLSDFLKGDK